MKPLLFVISCVFILAACNSHDQASNPLNVKVVDAQGQGIANATVVMGTQGGALVSFLSTNARGEAYFALAPSNATVTAAFSCYAPSENRTYYSLDVAYDVNTSAVALTLGACTQNTDQVNINVTDAIAGITSHDVTLGPITYGGDSPTMDVAWSLQDDGKVSVFATGYDDAGAIKGYGFALDRPPTAGSAIGVVIDRTDLVRHTHRLANVPLSAVSYYAFAPLLRKHAATSLPFNFLGGSAPLPDTVTTYSAGSFSDNNMFGVTVTLDQDGDGSEDATVGLVRYLYNPSDQLFDFSAVPVVPATLTYDPGTAGRPIISWSNKDPLATVQMLSFSYRANSPQRVSFYYSMTVPAAAANLVYPELPDILANFRPAAYSNLSLQTLKFGGLVSYKNYLQATANYNGRFYEAEGLSSYSYASISRLP